jgi:oligoribonuclease NrnB/cAMP/cGMP phosphodiesterase (DHH superfamily)
MLQIKDAETAVVIYHANCTDGFASAWAFQLLKAKDYKDVSYIADTYGGEPNKGEEVLDGKDVYILDFSYTRDELIRMCVYANKVILIDHHKTAQEALENWEDKPANLEINFDMSKAGCLLTWEYFNEVENTLSHETPPKLIQYIADRDIWAFKLSNSKEINAVVAITPHIFREYHFLNEDLYCEYDKVEAMGSALLSQH